MGVSGNRVWSKKCAYKVLPNDADLISHIDYNYRAQSYQCPTHRTPTIIDNSPAMGVLWNGALSVYS